MWPDWLFLEGTRGNTWARMTVRLLRLTLPWFDRHTSLSTGWKVAIVDVLHQWLCVRAITWQSSRYCNKLQLDKLPLQHSWHVYSPAESKLLRKRLLVKENVAHRMTQAAGEDSLSAFLDIRQVHQNSTDSLTSISCVYLHSSVLWVKAPMGKNHTSILKSQSLTHRIMEVVEMTRILLAIKILKHLQTSKLDCLSHLSDYYITTAFSGSESPWVIFNFY